jgi:FkbM family methyltransferase
MNWAFIREVGPVRWAARTAVRQFYKRALRRDHGMRLPTGKWMNLPIGDRFASEAFITGADVDWGSEKLMASLLHGTGAFLDVGAHIGYYSLYMRPGAAAVYSFEPDPRVMPLLEKNVGGKPGMEMVPRAVGAKPGRARFILEADSEASHLAGEGDSTHAQIVVEVVTLDAFVAARDLLVEAVKIDVEGHDLEVLQGALEVLRRQEPLVLTEARPDDGLFALMAQVSYRVFAYVRHSRSRKRWFAELRAGVPVGGETKMLFLVPRRLAAEFEEIADGR